MVEKPPYLTLVDPTHFKDHDEEFLPLPFYPWDERPGHLALDHDEIATALHMAEGDLVGSAALLKVPVVQNHKSSTSFSQTPANPN